MAPVGGGVERRRIIGGRPPAQARLRRLLRCCDELRQKDRGRPRIVRACGAAARGAMPGNRDKAASGG